MNDTGTLTLVQTILDTLFAKETARLHKLADALIINNNEACGENHNSLMFNGRVYAHSTFQLGPKRPTLHKSLFEMAEDLITDETTIENDRGLVHQAILLVIRNCEYLQDYRDALPDCLKDCFQAISKHSRTREEAYTLKDNPRAMAQYLKIRPKLEFYSVSRLLY